MFEIIKANKIEYFKRMKFIVIAWLIISLALAGIGYLITQAFTLETLIARVVYCIVGIGISSVITAYSMKSNEAVINQKE